MDLSDATTTDREKLLVGRIVELEKELVKGAMVMYQTLPVMDLFSYMGLELKKLEQKWLALSKRTDVGVVVALEDLRSLAADVDARAATAAMEGASAAAGFVSSLQRRPDAPTSGE